jgi:hypothetical protein
MAATDRRKQVLVIERWQPSPLNKLLKHWRTAQRLKTVDRNMVNGYCRLNRFRPAVGPREVNLCIVLGPKQRACDPDAYWKSTLDALVKAGMLIDDNRQYCRINPVTFERGPQRETRIELIDI